MAHEHPDLDKSATPGLLNAYTLGGSERWVYQTLHDEPPPGYRSGWLLLSHLPAQVRRDLLSLCVDPENTFPALFNGEPCVVIEQEFQASDAGDEWPETGSQVVERLRRALLSKLEPLLKKHGGLAGIVADPSVTFCGRPTLFVALPAASSSSEQVRDVLRSVRGFAYPESH
jgi:hypothetical protein